MKTLPIALLLISLSSTTMAHYESAFDSCTTSADIRSVLLVGLGKQGKEYYELLRNNVNFAGFVTRDPKSSVTQSFLEKTPGIPVFASVEDAIKNVQFDVAIIALPHGAHFDAVLKLLKAQKVVIKEKPLAINIAEVAEFKEPAKDGIVPILTTVQRHFQSTFIEATKDLALIGSPKTFEYEWYFNFEKPTSGWRAQKSAAAGGVLLDMGYHIIDVVNDFFGLPSEIDAKLGYCFSTMQSEGLEDAAIVGLKYASGLMGQIRLSRNFTGRKEALSIVGTDGTIVITPRGYIVYDPQGKQIKVFVTNLSKEAETKSMMLTFLANISNGSYLHADFKRNEGNMQVLTDIYARAQIEPQLLTPCTISELDPASRQ